MLRVMLRRPVLAVGVAAILGAVTVVLFYQVGTGFFPAADEGGFVLDYLTPSGSALAETDRQVRAIETVVSATPEVASYSRRTGSELGLFATAQNTGDLLVRLKPRNQRSRSSDEIITDVRARAHFIDDRVGDHESSAMVTPVPPSPMPPGRNVATRASCFSSWFTTSRSAPVPLP